MRRTGISGIQNLLQPTYGFVHVPEVSMSTEYYHATLNVAEHQHATFAEHEDTTDDDDYMYNENDMNVANINTGNTDIANTSTANISTANTSTANIGTDFDDTFL